jgi:trigger factor
MNMEDYLKQAGKTMEDLRKEWKPDAEKRAKLQLIFNEIAKKEKITPDSEKLEREIKHIKEHYPDANEESVGVYVAAQMTNDLVFSLLEGKKPEVSTKTEEKKEEHVHDETCDHDHKD